MLQTMGLVFKCVVFALCMKLIASSGLHDRTAHHQQARLMNIAMENVGDVDPKEGCLKYFKVETPYKLKRNDSLYFVDHPELVINLKCHNMIRESITFGETTLEIKPDPFLPPCLTKHDIESVVLSWPFASESDVDVLSITTYMAESINSSHRLLTYDPSFNESVFEENFEVPLSMAIGDDCIKVLGVTGKTSNAYFAGTDPGHKLVLKLQDDRELHATLPTEKDRGAAFSDMLQFKRDFLSCECVTASDIVEVRLEAGNNDGWLVSEITTIAGSKFDSMQVLTKDLHFNEWVDRDGQYPYDATKHILTLI